MEKNTNKNITNVISKSKRYDEVLDEIIGFHAAEEADTKMEDATEIAELQLDHGLLDNVAVHYTENNELTTTESVARKIHNFQYKMSIQKKKRTLMT